MHFVQIHRNMAKTIPIKKFSVRLIIFSVVIAGLAALAQLLLKQYVTPMMPFIVLFFFIVTSLTLYVVLRDDQGRNNRKFISGYMLSRIIKFFSCLLFLVIYLLLCPNTDRLPFAIAFFIIYFAYSTFEVVILKKENDQLHSSENNNKTE